MYMPHAHAYTYAYGIRIHAYAYARTHTHAILVCQPPDAWGDNPAGEKEKTRFYQFRLPEATDGCYADLTADTATDVPYGPWWDPNPNPNPNPRALTLTDVPYGPWWDPNPKPNPSPSPNLNGRALWSMVGS